MIPAIQYQTRILIFFFLNEANDNIAYPCSTLTLFYFFIASFILLLSFNTCYIYHFCLAFLAFFVEYVFLSSPSFLSTKDYSSNRRYGSLRLSVDASRKVWSIPKKIEISGGGIRAADPLVHPLGHRRSIHQTMATPPAGKFLSQILVQRIH